ncbi:glutathione S-transferase family protein [Pseudodonghicola flavimaris]|uniref:Glutathione S-transferase N-terminal domain-containing protein n=1 Tax=Pseudodonghicola flavimaris TaxID=3050036 RepID=A0ABT7F2I0_9RHOB|nr:glutathione S-transferase N-terminal domain-containing protein [Pseudodonghicola flavimaris]MDK3018821.1 glutathione S-transferase N-terminal domain-containing protein [Pseudodonghicola flavimaris]
MIGLTLFHAPNACSEGIALLLRVVGVAHDIRIVDLSRGAQRAPDYLAVSPKGKVPALRRPDGTVLTEFPAIAFWLAKRFPEAALIGDGTEAETRALELTEFIVSSLHMRGFTLMKVPQKFLSDPAAQADLRAHGRAEVERGLSRLAEVLGSRPFLLGRFGIADAAAFYVLRWAEQEDLPLATGLRALLRRIEALDRPAPFTP